MLLGDEHAERPAGYAAGQKVSLYGRKHNRRPLEMRTYLLRYGLEFVAGFATLLAVVIDIADLETAI